MKRLLVVILTISLLLSGCAKETPEAEPLTESPETEPEGTILLVDNEDCIYLRVVYATEKGFVGLAVPEPGSAMREGKEFQIVIEEGVEIFLPVDATTHQLFDAAEITYTPGMLIEVQYTREKDDTIYPELMYVHHEVPWQEVEPECCIDQMPWYNAQITDFGLGLLRGSVEEGKNTLISPVSVYAALSMTANGAAGETLAQMEAVLGREKDAFNQWYKEDMSKDSDYLHLSNTLYIKDDPELTVDESFVKTIETYYAVENYDTDVVISSFNEYAVDGINHSVADNTDGMIRNMVTEIPEDAVMCLVNALAFDAHWEKPYEEYQVSEGIFTTEDGRKQTVELMYAEDTYAYVEDDLCTGFLKDYEGGRYAFVALLPNAGVTVKELADSLSGDAVPELLSYRWEGKVLTAMPKFQTEFDTEMGEVLSAMGMRDAFDPALADFSALATYAGNPVFINRVLHKSFISVGEQGTRAGTATVAEIAAGDAMAPEEPKEVILNRPFLYLIWDAETNMPIFMGTFMDVQAEGTSVPADDPGIFYSPAEEYLAIDPCMCEG